VTFISKSAAADVLPEPHRAAARVIYNGLPEPAPAPSFRLVPSPEPVELLFVGANSVRKRVELLPFVLRRVRLRRPGARLRIIGFGRDDNQELLDRARGLGVLDAIVFEGRKRSEELQPYYRASRVLLVPSSYEGLPMVILEAFQAGLPCVATRVSGHPEVIEEGVNGFLVELDRPDRMAEAALRIIDDPELGRRMGAHGRARVANAFHADRQAAEYLKLYCELRTETARSRRNGHPG
jgi:glycosyltransferase involved in cell wall biosynthesis